MSAKEIETHLKPIAAAFKEILDSKIVSGGGLVYTQEPEIIERDIVEYDSRMRVQGMEKFNAPCYLAAVNFYRSEADKAKNKSLGALIIYLNQVSADKFLKALKYKVKIDDDDEVIMENTGIFCADVANELLERIKSLGYSSLVPGQAQVERNTIGSGISFDYNEYKMLELVFHVWKEKACVANITLGAARS